MKVLIVAPGGAPIPATRGGAVECLIDYIVQENEIQKRMELTVVSMFDSDAYSESTKFQSTKIEFIKFPKVILVLDKVTYWLAKYILRKKKVLSYRFIFQRFWTVLKTQKILKDNEFDKVIIDNHVILLYIFKNKLLQNKYKGKFYYHIHNVMNNDLGCADILQKCKKIITVSDFVTDDFLKKYPLYKKENISKLANVSDLRRFGKQRVEDVLQMKKKFKISEKDTILMFAGRLDETKGVLEVIKAFSMLSIRNIRLVIVGSYAFKTGISNGFDDELKKLVENDDRVIFTGFIDFAQMPIVYSMADIMILPSLCEDAAPLSVIESLCSGNALITTKAGGIPEYAQDKAIILDRNGELINNIKSSMETLIYNKHLRDEMKDKAYRGTRLWTTSKFYSDFINIIEK